MRPGSDEDDEREARVRCGIVELQPCGIGVTLQVVDAHQWQAARECQGFGGVHPHHQRSGEAGPVRDGDCPDVV